MKENLSQINDWMKKFGKNSPEKMKSFNRVLEKMGEEGALSKKDKELIAVALSVVQKCKWCISLHVKNALDAGATEEEIIESTWMALLMGGGPAMMHSGLVLEALEDFQAD